MTTTETTNAQMDYPTTKDVLIKMIELDKADKLTGGDFDEMTYDAAGEWDEKFDGDINWCNAEAAEEDEDFDMFNDCKDQIRDRLINLFEEAGIDEDSFGEQVLANTEFMAAVEEDAKYEYELAE